MLGKQVDGPTSVVKPAMPARRRAVLWGGGLSALALAAGLAWMAHVDSTESAAAAASAASSAVDKPAALVKAEPAAGAEPEAGAAARINDESAAGSSAALTALLEKENPQTLREMLSAKPAPTPAPGAGVDMLSKALASPAASEPAKVAPKAKAKAPGKDEATAREHPTRTATKGRDGKAVKAGAKERDSQMAGKTAAKIAAKQHDAKHDAKHGGKQDTRLAEKAHSARSKTREARLAKLRERKAQQTLLAAKGHKNKTAQEQALAKKSNRPPAQSEPDSDVALLAALVAHTQANSPEANGTTQTRLKQCKPMKNADAEQCRAQVCAGRWKSDTECKALSPAAVPLAKNT